MLFHEFMADDLGTVARIYERADFALTAPARAELDAFLTANPRGKHGQVVYDLRGNLGIDPADVRKRFAFHFERFAVRPER